MADTVPAAGPGIPGGPQDVDTVVAAGEGDYAGLSAYLVIDGSDVQGLIFPGTMPPFPEPFAAVEE